MHEAIQLARHSPPNSIGLSQTAAALVAPQYSPSYTVEIGTEEERQALCVITDGECKPTVNIQYPPSVPPPPPPPPLTIALTPYIIRI